MSQTVDTMRETLIQTLLDQRMDGVWEGELSTSALSTATAVTALHMVDAKTHGELVLSGLNWLAVNQNADGGWGDTTVSKSNISTTALCWGALNLRQDDCPALLNQAEAKASQWLRLAVGDLDPEAIQKALMARYGKDHTFSIPILTMLAICGRLGPAEDAWKRVAPLPFELAAIPQRFYKTVRMPVVSYALPALIAIGQAIHHHRGTKNPVTALARKWTAASTLDTLAGIQPDSGGFLEAVPLTAFVSMSLASMGLKDHQVVVKGVGFLLDLVRDDGSWPIDTHLQTWVTTLSINALSGGAKSYLDDTERQKLSLWLMDQQYQGKHPYTGAAPGGWAWTPLTGGVPDADDTSGAVIALANLAPKEPVVRAAAKAGIEWLLGLQNGDGGIPTFCKGWGTLPFDKSCPDITAHALLAFHHWHQEGLYESSWARREASMVRYLQKEQQQDGSWIPLWFGNEHHSMERNPTYGTAKVVTALARRNNPNEAKMLRAGVQWLLSHQRTDGGWGSAEKTPATIEETALALEALQSLSSPPEQSVQRGLTALANLTQAGTHWPASPIGFYFANLWYHERLYPLVYAVSAVNPKVG